MVSTKHSSSRGHTSKQSPRPTAVSLSYQQEQPQNTVTAKKQNDSIKDSSEFDDNGPFKFNYVVPSNPTWRYFTDSLKDRRDITQERTEIKLGHSDESCEIVTTEIHVDDVFALENKQGKWKFVGMTKRNPLGETSTYAFVFKPVDSYARRTIEHRSGDYVDIPVGDFVQKFGPFENIASQLGHTRLGYMEDNTITEISDPDPSEDNTTSTDNAEKTERKGPLNAKGKRYMTYSTVPVSLL